METRGELNGVTSTKRMTSEQCVRPPDDLRRELHYEHRGKIVVQDGQRAFTSGLGQQTLSRSAHQRRNDLDMRESACCGNVAGEQASYCNAASFSNIANCAASRQGSDCVALAARNESHFPHAGVHGDECRDLMALDSGRRSNVAICKIIRCRFDGPAGNRPTTQAVTHHFLLGAAPFPN
jgi:hypothetical protein